MFKYLDFKARGEYALDLVRWICLWYNQQPLTRPFGGYHAHSAADLETCSR